MFTYKLSRLMSISSASVASGSRTLVADSCSDHSISVYVYGLSFLRSRPTKTVSVYAKVMCMFCILSTNLNCKYNALQVRNQRPNSHRHNIHSSWFVRPWTLASAPR